MEPEPRTPDLNAGADLPEVIKTITQENINLYARASGDFNPIHIDSDFAAKTPLGGTIAHGMLILAYVSQMMTAAFGKSWLTGGRLNVRLKAPARPGDTITVSGKISGVDKSTGPTLVNCSILVTNQNGETVIIGDTRVEVNNGDA